ncbi:MAG TPA: queuosine precursor transporter [Anaerolineaceae bacterium]|nr:queuosine precursor transporter [Anaerolineaceae bacterium]
MEKQGTEAATGSQTPRRRAYRYYDMVMAIFITVLIVSNIASSAKIIDWGVSLFGLPLAFDGGTLLFPISYIFGDVLTEVYGFKGSRRVIWMGFACLALAAFVLWLVRVMPGEASWQQYAGQGAYDAILGGMSSGGIVLASLLAYWAGEFTNSVVLARMKVITQGRWLWTRTIGSTLVGQVVDTGIFLLVATATGVFTWELFPTLFVSNYIFKVGIEALMTPATYAVVNTLKRREQEDYYDIGTNFNPFGY